MGILSIFRGLIADQPTFGSASGAVGRFFRWQVATRVQNYPVAVPFAGNTRLLVKRGMAGATGNVYRGLHEFADMAFVVHVLRKGDLFVDVGANVGTYTVLAAGVAGADCMAFEPAPETFETLLDNVHLNRLSEKATCFCSAVGGACGTVEFTRGLDSVNRVLKSGEQVRDKITVPVTTLDKLLSETCPRVIKIDVEGFETAVIDGAQRSLNNETLCAVIMETNGQGLKFGFDEELLHQRMLGWGYDTFQYLPRQHVLRSLGGRRNAAGNTLYVRNCEWVKERLRTAEKFLIQASKEEL